MEDDIPHDGAPSEVPVVPPVAKAKEPVVDEVDGAAEDIIVNFEVEEVFSPGPEPELLPLRLRPFHLATYYPRTHAMVPRDMLRFEDFAVGVPEDVLLRERTFHLSHGATEGDSRSRKGYGTVTARDWYQELPIWVHELVDEASFDLFCFGLS
ncbi:hypothetical protein ACSBR1_029730 [Camellia fascicularis]